MFMRKLDPQVLPVTKAQRDSAAAARVALRDAARHLAPDEAFDLLLAQYGDANPEAMHAIMQKLERAADAKRHDAHMAQNGANLARMAWVR
jgi:hypothetical protein